MKKIFISTSCALDHPGLNPETKSFQKQREKYRRRSLGEVEEFEKRKSLEQETDEEINEKFDSIVHKMMKKKRNSFYLSDVKIIETDNTTSNSEFELNFKPGSSSSNLMKTDVSFSTESSQEVDHPTIMRYFGDSVLENTTTTIQ
eukprot:gene10735-3355_t